MPDSTVYMQIQDWINQMVDQQQKLTADQKRFHRLARENGFKRRGDKFHRSESEQVWYDLELGKVYFKAGNWEGEDWFSDWLHPEVWNIQFDTSNLWDVKSS